MYVCVFYINTGASGKCNDCCWCVGREKREKQKKIPIMFLILFCLSIYFNECYPLALAFALMASNIHSHFLFLRSLSTDCCHMCVCARTRRHEKWNLLFDFGSDIFIIKRKKKINRAYAQRTTQPCIIYTCVLKIHIHGIEFNGSDCTLLVVVYVYVPFLN